jgi:uncharacterized protein (UPF0332 family)
MFFDPEIRRRKTSGTWKDDETVVAAQVLFFPDGKLPLVRLNAEVAAEVKVKKGLPLDDPDFHPASDEVEYIRLREDEYKDCGHATMILLRDGYQLSFDFIYNKTTAGRYLPTAKEYLEMTTLAIDHQHLIAAMDTAYTAMELLATASLLLEANERMKTNKKHNGVVSAFHVSKRNSSDPTDQRQKEILQRLFDVRNKAKYGQQAVALPVDELKMMLQEMENLYGSLSSRIKAE